MTTAFPEPAPSPDLRGLMLDFLDFLRGSVADKVDGLSDEALQASVVPSGWTPAGLVNHLVHVERRWLRWGFLAEHLDAPWRDATEDGGWVSPEASAAQLRDLLRSAGERSRAIVEAHALTETASLGGRFTDAASAPDLQWILLHLVQEYARHAGHLDIARELVDGVTGEGG
jgi:uncharacterized damage-inducible protein DinB